MVSLAACIPIHHHFIKYYIYIVVWINYIYLTFTGTSEAAGQVMALHFLVMTPSRFGFSGGPSIFSHCPIPLPHLDTKLVAPRVYLFRCEHSLSAHKMPKKYRGVKIGVYESDNIPMHISGCGWVSDYLFYDPVSTIDGYIGSEQLTEVFFV